MTRVAVLLAMLCAMGSDLVPAAQQEKKEVAEGAARKAIGVFQQNPGSPEGKAAGKVVLLFALQSKDVVLVFGKEENGWLGIEKDKQDENTSHLMVAYAAGSVLSQLDSKKKAHDMYAALQQVFRTYQQLQKQDKDFKRPELDKLMAMDKESKLKPYTAEIQEKRGDHKLGK